MPPPNSPHAAPGPRRSGDGVGKKIALGCGCLLLVFFLAIAVAFIPFFAWIGGSVQPTPATYSAPELTTEQRSDVERILADQEAAYRDRTDWEIEFTPELFNAYVADRIARAKEDGSYDPMNDPAGVEILFDGSDTVVRFTLPAAENGYVNVEIRGEPTVEDERFLGRVDSLELGGHKAPWLARLLIDALVQSARQGQQVQVQNTGQDVSFDGIKLLRREGDKLHVILDSSVVPEPE